MDQWKALQQILPGRDHGNDQPCLLHSAYHIFSSDSIFGKIVPWQDFVKTIKKDP